MPETLDSTLLTTIEPIELSYWLIDAGADRRHQFPRIPDFTLMY